MIYGGGSPIAKTLLPQGLDYRTLVSMRHRLTAFWLILMISLQGPLALAAVSSSMPSDSHAAMHGHHSGHACCHTQGAHVKCCPDACTGAATVAGSPGLLVWYGRTTPSFKLATSPFSSHGETPLIRPPIF